jgi:hypothetical protein
MRKSRRSSWHLGALGGSECADLHRFMTDRFPQLMGVRVTHAWTGNVAFTWDTLPHTGVFGGMHYALGCNGSGVAMMTYLGHHTARRIAGSANSTCGFELEVFPDFPLYNGSPNGALPAIGALPRRRQNGRKFWGCMNPWWGSTTTSPLLQFEGTPGWQPAGPRMQPNLPVRASTLSITHHRCRRHCETGCSTACAECRVDGCLASIRSAPRA